VRGRRYREPVRSLHFIPLLTLLASACVEPDFRLQLVFPDQEAEALVTEVLVWAIKPEAASCSELIDGSARPEDQTVRAQVLIEMNGSAGPGRA